MSDNVTRFYDANTRRFLRYGQGGAQSAIHRAVWAPGVRSRAEAMDYINRRAAAEAEQIGADTILDIGCGVGGSLISLARRTGAAATGITLSSAQQQIGQVLLERQHCADRCRIIAGDFLAPRLPEQLEGPFGLSLAVEALIHMQDPAAFFRRAAALTAPGGRLLLCDDFLAPGVPRSGREERLLQRFRRGWHTAGLRTAGEIRSRAAEAGFILQKEENLTAFLELGRPRDRLIRLLVTLTAPLPLASPFWENLRGGDALQRLLSARALTYRLLIFSR
jgi:cyclopropane fatty-acyl-phospholipid synthase-like methyltransferase